MAVENAQVCFSVSGDRVASHREKQRIPSVLEPGEAVMQVEGCGSFVLGVDDERAGRDLRTAHTHQRVGQKNSAQTLPCVLRVNCQSSHEYCGNQRIPRQFFRDGIWKIGKHQACRCKRIETGNPLFPGEKNEASGRSSPDVLRYSMLEIVVQFPGAALEPGAVESGMQRDDSI